jgi:hypothetical protein
MLTPAMLVNRFREGNIGDSYFALIDLVMEDVKEQAYSTYLSKLSAVNQFKKFASPSLVLPAVTPGYIQRFQDHLRKTKPRYGNKLKGATINNYFDRLHNFLPGRSDQRVPVADRGGNGAENALTHVHGPPQLCLARQIMQQQQNMTLTVYDIQLMMGHSSFKTTEGYYRESADQDTSEPREWAVTWLS